MSEGTQRRLAAIVAADVAGYSRLMGADEDGTLAVLKAHRRELVDPKVAEHRGRIVKTTGDGILLEFASVLDAVRCCVEVQQGMVKRNAREPEERQMLFRVGINLGDIIIDGDDIHGDGVNIAARLEAIAEPGGIAVSGNVHEQVQGKIDVQFADDGLHEVKNIAKPVQVWRWSAVGTPTSAVAETVSHDALPLPDKPSIAVLPFANMSGDGEQEYFADGITEDITTALSRVGWFFVIARNSSFTFKGRSVDVKQVARQLGVRYILEGSVRKAGTRLRVTAQLIDALSGNHIWADRFDGRMVDVFDFQDQVTESVVGAIEPKLRQSEIQRAIRKRSDNLDAYDIVLRGLHKNSIVSKEGNDEAQKLFDAALNIDPEYAIALACGAWCRSFSVLFNWTENEKVDSSEGLRMARQAIEADPEDATTLRMAGTAIAIISRDHENARSYIDKSLI